MSLSKGLDIDELHADDVSFDTTGIPWSETNVQAALAAIRTKVITTPSSTATTTNGTLTLTVDSNSLQFITGTATGFSVILPDATTLFNGRKFEIINDSSVAITIKSHGGSSLAVLNAKDVLLLTLKDNTTSVGMWSLLAITSLAAGVNAFNVTQSATFSTSSMTDTIITDLTYTPVSGTYGVWFSSDLNIGTNNAIAQCVIFKAGTAVGDTRRNIQGIGSNYKANLQSLGIIQVNGSEALDVRVNVSSGAIDLTGRSLLLIRLGA